MLKIPRWRIILTTGMIFCNCAAWAQMADSNNLSRDEFAAVINLLRSMPPEEQQAILAQAAAKEKDLKQMTPQEQEILNQKLHKIASTIYMEKIDPEKLDPAKSKNTQQIAKDLDLYMDKFQQGKINNSAVKPLAASQ